MSRKKSRDRLTAKVTISSFIFFEHFDIQNVKLWRILLKAMELFYSKKYNVQFFCALFCVTSFFAIAREASAFQLPGTLSEVRHDVDVGGDFLKWSLGPNKTDPVQDVSEVSIFLRAAIENAETDFQEGIINEDYPKLTLAALEQAVVQDADAEGKSYVITKSHRDVPPPLSPWPAPAYATPLPADIRQTPLGKQGLSNNTGECYIDTALQMLRAELLPVAMIGTDGNTISFPAYPSLNKNISCLPYLQKFLLNKISTDEEARSLRMEVAQFIDWKMIVGRPWNPAENVSMGETGCSFEVGGYGGSVLRALLYTLYAPAAIEINQNSFSENTSSQTKQAYEYSAHLRQLFIPAVAAGEEVAMDQVIQEDLNTRGRQLMSPLPPVISCQLIPTASAVVPFPAADSQPYDFNQTVFNRFPSIATNLLNSIELLLPSTDHSSPKNYFLKPIAVSVRMYVPTVGHLFSFIYERGNWYEINNDQVFAIPGAWVEDMSLYISRYPTQVMISYETMEEPQNGIFIPPFEVNVLAAAPTDAEAKALHEQMKAIYQTNPKLVVGLVNYKFFWWAFYKHHPDLRADLDLLMHPSATN